MTTAENSLPSEAAAAPKKFKWFRALVIIFFALFYAYDLFEGIQNTFGVVGQLTQFNEYQVLNGLNPVEIPWSILIANMVTPVVVFGLCLLFTRKRNVGVLSMVLLAGLGVVGALTLSFIALAGLVS